MDPEITSSDLRSPLGPIPGEGVGIVEAQRGTLTHHYWTNEKGMVTKVNIIVGTTNNHAAICMSIKKAAEGFIKKGVEVHQGILNMIEMAFRAYDPCFSCATHCFPGQMPMILEIRQGNGELVQRLIRD
jgi:F420-non-reducing hydrogenase large subunit